MRFQEMLRLYLAANNISQKQAAKEMGISESTLSRFLSKNSEPSMQGFVDIYYWCFKSEKP